MTASVGFNEDNVMVVAKTMSSAEAKELKIRDGCCFGPVLVMNGEVNEEAYNTTFRLQSPHGGRTGAPTVR